jgi:hypothetical protein
MKEQLYLEQVSVIRHIHLYKIYEQVYDSVGYRNGT